MLLIEGNFWASNLGINGFKLIPLLRVIDMGLNPLFGLIFGKENISSTTQSNVELDPSSEHGQNYSVEITQ